MYDKCKGSSGCCREPMYQIYPGTQHKYPVIPHSTARNYQCMCTHCTLYKFIEIILASSLHSHRRKCGSFCCFAVLLVEHMTPCFQACSSYLYWPVCSGAHAAGCACVVVTCIGRCVQVCLCVLFTCIGWCVQVRMLQAVRV